ncbi:MAG TPA: hypothetical protein VKG89_02780 [Solirubrobacterales bacterium]|nr:hypothetical protein [Solirubrobacterales bacterium]
MANTASDGNVSSVKFIEAPNKAPKTKFHKGTLTLGTKTVFNPALPASNGGDTDRVQLWVDDDIKINPNAAPTCNPAFSSGTTMAQAMAACGNAKVGVGRSHSANTAGNIPGCVLVFNGTNKRVILFSRLFSSAPLDCANPSSNNGGDISVTLFGKLKHASGDYGTRLDVPNIHATVPAPLGDFTAKLKRKSYITARCHDGNHKWNVKGQHTYTDGVNSVDKVKQSCKVS